MKLTEEQRKLIDQADIRYPEHEISYLLPPCPKCGKELSYDRSVCQDPECCCVPNLIVCTSRCGFSFERYGSLLDLFEEFFEGVDNGV